MQIPGIPYTHGGLTVEYTHRACCEYTFRYNALCVEWASDRSQSVGRNWTAFFMEHTSYTANFGPQSLRLLGCMLEDRWLCFSFSQRHKIFSFSASSLSLRLTEGWYWLFYQE